MFNPRRGKYAMNFAKKIVRGFSAKLFPNTSNRVASLYAKIRTIVVIMWTTTCLLVVNHETVHKSLSLIYIASSSITIIHNRGIHHFDFA